MKHLNKTFILAALLMFAIPRLAFSQLNCSSLSNVCSSILLTSPSDLCCSNFYHLDALKMGSDADYHIFIGGSSPNLPILWNAYPSSHSGGGLYYYPEFENSSSMGGPAMQLIYEQWTGRMSFQYSTNTTWSAGDQVTWATGLNFDANGNVAIGTETNSCYMLTVNGGIACKSVKVITPTSWCDYVYKKKYKLMPIKDLDAFVTKNHHLPDVPTEDEVKANGIDVADMDAKLLKKIEEMSLYIISLNKQLESLQKQVKALQTAKK